MHLFIYFLPSLPLFLTRSHMEERKEAVGKNKREQGNVRIKREVALYRHLYMLAMRYLVTFYRFSYIYILPISFFFFILILSTRFPCPLYQRGWDCTAWWVNPCVGVSLCVDVRLCRPVPGQFVMRWSVVV